jgi:hypothetical protein
MLRLVCVCLLASLTACGVPTGDIVEAPATEVVSTPTNTPGIVATPQATPTPAESPEETPMPTDPTPSPDEPADPAPTPTPPPGPDVTPLVPEPAPLPPGVTHSPPLGAGLESMVSLAQQDLASRQGVTVETIERVEVRSVVWPDGSLGCPSPGMMYPQVQVDGLFVRFRIGERLFDYHGGGARPLFLCEQNATVGDPPLPIQGDDT